MSKSAKLAIRAFCQWHFGDETWAEQIIRIAEADDPIEAAEEELEGETVEGVLGEGRVLGRVPTEAGGAA